jgi:hypothetical protein
VLGYNLECGCEFEDPDKTNTEAEAILIVTHSGYIKL